MTINQGITFSLLGAALCFVCLYLHWYEQVYKPEKQYQAISYIGKPVNSSPIASMSPVIEIKRFVLPPANGMEWVAVGVASGCVVFEQREKGAKP